MKVCCTCSTLYTGTSWHCPSCGHTPPLVGGFPALAPALALEGGGFQPELFEHLASLEANNFWFQARNRLIIWALKRQFPNMTRYLEIGCGTGYVLSGVAAAFPGVVITGSEIFSSGLEFASRRVPNAELLQMDARHLPYESDFDVIGAYDVLEHIPEDQAVLMQMHHAVRHGGGIILTVPQHPWLWSRQDDYACHVRRYRLGELRDKVRRVGFKIELETSFVSLLLPAMVASRMVQRSKAPDTDPMSELRLSRWLNQVFTGFMTCERLAIRLGVRLPLGGSLLLVAKRL